MTDHDIKHTRIKKLSPLLINQLAAGEVITRPAAVVKELLENAIDAGATRISVRITQGGMGMIEVSDNGSGIHPDDMVMAITRHATSKVADVANLQGIATLGFRGEALAATAAVSRLTLTSSHDDSGVGRQLSVAGVLDDTPVLTPVVHTQGTTVTVKDLYFNVPARRGHLKSIATEFNHIETTVRDVALACADINIELIHDNKKRLQLIASDTANTNRLPLSRLEQALGTSLGSDAHGVAIDLSGLASRLANHTEQTPAAISGWLWTPHDKSSVKLIYINGRVVKEPLITNELRKLLSEFGLSTLSYALYFELPSTWLGVNVHPSKQRIKIGSLNNILAHMNHMLRHQLRALAPNNADNNVSSSPDNRDSKPAINYPYHSRAANAATPQKTGHDNKHDKLNQHASNYELRDKHHKHNNSHVQEPKSAYQFQTTYAQTTQDQTTHAQITKSVAAPQSISQLNKQKQAYHDSQCFVLQRIERVPDDLLIDKAKDKPLPWLLVSSNNELVLITQSDLRAIMADISSNAGVSENITIDNINHQLIAADDDKIVSLLRVYAIATLTTEALITLMLSM